jgi:hypothetical protein
VDVSSYLVAAAVVVWVVARQFTGRWVPARRSLLLPLVLVAVGVGQAGQCAVFNARAARDGRPIRPARRRADTRATLAR